MTADDADAADAAYVRVGGSVLDPVARSLGFHASSPTRSLMSVLVTRALRFLPPRSVSDREHRLLLSAEQLASDAQDGAHHNVLDHASLYLALAACSWAANKTNDALVRDAALALALGCATRTNANIRVALGVDERLITLGQDDVLHPKLRELAREFENDGAPSEAKVVKSLAIVLDTLERRTPLGTKLETARRRAGRHGA